MKNRASSHLLIIFIIIGLEIVGYLGVHRAAALRGYETSVIGGVRDLLMFIPLIILVLWLSRSKHFIGNWVLFTTAILLFSFGMPDVPVDTHVYRVGTRLGLFRPKASFEEAHDEMLRLVGDDADEAYEVHVGLIRHGRRTCTARNPDCDNCPLLSLCPYGKARQRAKLGTRN